MALSLGASLRLYYSNIYASGRLIIIVTIRYDLASTLQRDILGMAVIGRRYVL